MTMTLQSLSNEVLRQKEATRDLIADTKRVSLVERTATSSGTVMVVDMPAGAEEFGITRHAHQQLAEKTDVPFKTYERLLEKHPPLLHHLVTGLLNREPSKRMIRTLDGRVRAVLSDRYQPRDNWELLENLLPVIQEYPQYLVRSCELTETRMYVKLFLPGMTRQIVGDVIRGGVIFQNSEVGDGSLGIYPYSDRLSCTNGMIHTDLGQRSIHVGRRVANTEEAYEYYSTQTMRLDTRAFYAKCKDTLRACLSEKVFDAIAQQMRDLAEIRVEGSPVDAVRVLSKEHNFTENEGKSILEHLAEGGDLSGWGYVNAITATARDHDDYTRQTELEAVAGQLVAKPAWARNLIAA